MVDVGSGGGKIYSAVTRRYLPGLQPVFALLMLCELGNSSQLRSLSIDSSHSARSGSALVNSSALVRASLSISVELAHWLGPGAPGAGPPGACGLVVPAGSGSPEDPDDAPRA